MRPKRHNAGVILLPMLLAGLAHAVEPASEPKTEPAKVMMMGVFHFANPGLFRMYANVQHAAAPGHCVLVIAGQGPAAILKDFLALDSQRKAVQVKNSLEPYAAGNQ